MTFRRRPAEGRRRETSLNDARLKRLLTAQHARDGADNEQHQEDEEQNLRDAGGRCGDAAKAQDASDKRYDEKHYSPV